MKFVLPLAAAVLVAVAVIWPGRDAVDVSFRLSETTSRGTTGTSEPAMTNARYIGTDSRNRPFVITADSARQFEGDPDRIILERLQADLTLDDGRWMALTAKSGLYVRGLESLRLEGPVNLYSDDGYAFEAEAADVDLQSGNVSSARPITGQGPLGHLNAGSYRLEEDGQRLFFSGGVKMVIFPQARS